MSGSDRQLYLTATVLDQQFLDYTAQDNLDTRLEMTVDISSSSGTIRASDRNKYVITGGVGYFYQALLVFPVIKRQIAHWLSPQLEFSTLTLELSNVDGRFNALEPGGASYTGFIGKTIEVKVGLRDVGSTYTTIFKGLISEIGGAGRTVKSLILTARDNFEKVNIDFPKTALTKTGFPNLETNKIGTILPVIYGDFTVNLNQNRSTVPAFVANGIAAGISQLTNVQCVISENANTFFDTTKVTLFRGNIFTTFNSADIVNVAGDNRTFEIKQNGTTLVLDDLGNPTTPYVYSNSDEILVRVKGKALGGLEDNIVAQAKDIIKTYGVLTDADFDDNWTAYQNKSSPAQSAIANFKSRVWVQEVQPAMTYALSMLSQVRLEAFIDRNFRVKLNALHFEDWTASPTFTVKNWDVIRDSFKPTIDERNNFNRCKAFFALDPASKQEIRQSAFIRNDAAIAQAGKQISKQIHFPNLYIDQDVIYNLTEILKLASATTELIEVQLTSRSLLQELGNFVKVSVQIGSSIFNDVPCMVREVGYDPAGLKLPSRLWSFQLCPFPGYTPSYAGIVGGFNAIIVTES